MNVKALLRTLLLALLVILAGCGISKKPVANVPTTGDTTSIGPPPVEPVPVKPAAPADQIANEAARPAPTNLPPQSAPAMQRMAASKGILANVYPTRPMAMPPMPGDINRENYAHRDSNPVQLVSEQPVSTFGIDVDTGSYTNVRRMLSAGQLPPADAVRAEEFINYFDYGYTPPADREQPFSVTTELAPAPWNAKRQLLLVGIQGYRVPKAQIPASNLVFLIDTSGSMDEPDKLPLLKASLKQLVHELRHEDHVAIVTYAGYAGVALPTPASRSQRVSAAPQRVSAAWGSAGAMSGPPH